MKRLTILFVVFVLLIGGYVALRMFSKPENFVAPQSVSFSDVDLSTIDGITLVFAQDKQIQLEKRDGTWFVDDLPADGAKVQSLLDAAASSTVDSRVSSNAQYHERFEVADKGVRMTLLAQESVKKELVFGKAAGGDSVYVRVPDQTDVFVMSGFPRYSLTEEMDQWRDRSLANVPADRIRMVGYAENQIQWELKQTGESWTVGTNRIAAVAVDTAKTETYLASIVGLRAIAFPTADEITATQKNRATFATVTLEFGTPDAFERKETWSVYQSSPADRLLVIRASDSVGLFVDTQTFDQVFGDFAQLKSAVVASAEEAVK